MRFWVADSGPGVHPDDAEHIFERFAHGRSERGATGPMRMPRARTGAGLGLAIVTAIAGGHDGTVHLRATRPGAEPPGATFELDLPRAGEGQEASA